MMVQLKIIQGCSPEVARTAEEVALRRGYVPTDDADAGVVLVCSSSEPRELLIARQQIDDLRARNLPVLGVSLDPVSQLSDVAAAMPHQDDWVEAKSLDADSIDDALAEVERRVAIALLDVQDSVSQRLRSRVATFKSAGKFLDRTPAEKSGVSVFVSYSRRDKLASDVVRELRRHGHEVWIDTSSIAGADDWRASIERGIRNSSVFVLLMSPNVAKSPRHVRDEVQFAERQDARIIPVYLRPTPNLPDGLGLPLSGTQWISMKPDFQQGMGRLLEAIGTPESSPVRTVRDRAGNMSANLRRVAHEQQLGKKVKRYGSAALVGGAVVGAAALKSLMDQQEQAEQIRRQEEVRSRAEYRDRTLRLLQQAQAELGRVDLGSEAGMDGRAFRQEFAPRFQRTIGALTAIKPADPDLRERHERLIETLEEVASDFGRAYQSIEDNDRAAFVRSISKIRSSAADAFEANIAWVVTIID